MDAVCRSRPEEADYYNTLTASFDIAVRYIDENHGKGCFAKRTLEKRAVVFRDRALVQLQSRKQTSLRPGVAPCSYPRSLATCEHCCRFVGSLWLQLALLCRGEALHLDAETNTHTGGVLRAHLPPDADFALPFISPEDATLTASVLTQQSPSGALLCYCSEHCRLEAEGRSLELSKVGPLADVWERFKQYADATGNRFFILAALIVQAVVHQLQKNGGNLAEATLPYRFMVKRPYWETIDQGEDPEALRREIESQTETSFRMLEQLFAEDLHRYPALRDDFFTLQTYSALLGGLNLNTMTIKVPSPLVSYFLMLDSMPIDSKQTAVLALRPLLLKLVSRVEDERVDSDSEEDDDDKEEEEEEEEAPGRVEGEGEGEGGSEGKSEGESEDESEGEDDPGEDDEFEFNWQDPVSGDSDGTLEFTSSLFPPLKGYAFFPLLSNLNHSCEPNCQVAYLEDGEAVVFALRDIEVDEELTISYIYQHLPLAARQAQLRSYGFLCQCPRCLREEPQPVLAGRPPKKARTMQ